VIIITAYSTVDTAVEAMRLGAYDYISKPFDMDELTMTVKRALEASTLRREVRERVREEKARFGIHNLVGKARPMQEIGALVRKVSQSQASTVLIRGESGSGKDVIARAIHFESARADKPFMNITCTALQDTLLESELFGHEKGAFTDAKSQKKGLFELANGGTVFLDEIGDMSPDAPGEAPARARGARLPPRRRLPGHQGRRRIIAATNRPLEKLIEEKKFREDLYLPAEHHHGRRPPLPERRADIPLLVDHFLKRFASEFRKSVTTSRATALRKLEAYEWPGNVRELKNVIERAVLLGSGPGGGRRRSDAGPHGGGAPEKDKKLFSLPAKGFKFDDLEKDIVLQALERTGGTRRARASSWA
jgi:DNA-binding NtrC family response regulator